MVQLKEMVRARWPFVSHRLEEVFAVTDRVTICAVAHHHQDVATVP
jgi:ABC-type sugar transport system ATPase subunit